MSHSEPFVLLSYTGPIDTLGECETGCGSPTVSYRIIIGEFKRFICEDCLVKALLDVIPVMSDDDE